MAAKRLIFGNENAEKDPLVLDCYVNNIGIDGQIITGRWGVGKTAYLFHRNSHLAAVLEAIDKKLKRIWYLDESQLDSDQVSKAYIELDTRTFKRYLKNIWKAEIYRRACILLSSMKPYFGEHIRGSHWNEIAAVAKTETAVRTIWRQIPAALTLLKLLDSSNKTELEGVQAEIEKLFSDRLAEDVQKCLEDIPEDKIAPVIAIEPIETPFSNLEKTSLAQDVISELVNVFQESFQPSDDQLLEVIVSIPWHRFSHNKEINLPQKVRQYVEEIHWNKERLKVFIERRIAWEFDRVGRAPVARGKTYWDQLFEPLVHNDYPRPEAFDERSFDYAIRHTTLRPRELQRIARLAVEVCAAKTGRGIDDILKGHGGIRVNGNHLREAIGKFVEGTSRDRENEAIRRFGHLEEVLPQLKGVPGIFRP